MDLFLRDALPFQDFAHEAGEDDEFATVPDLPPERSETAEVRTERVVRRGPPQHRAAAAEEFARVEGILPAPESSHAIKVALDEAKKCIETGEEKTIVFGLTGTGYFDMVAYEKFHNGTMDDYVPSDEELEKYFETLPPVE